MNYKKEEKDKINEKQAVVGKLCDNWTVKGRKGGKLHQDDLISGLIPYFLCNIKKYL